MYLQQIFCAHHNIQYSYISQTKVNEEYKIHFEGKYTSTCIYSLHILYFSENIVYTFYANVISAYWFAIMWQVLYTNIN